MIKDAIDTETLLWIWSEAAFQKVFAVVWYLYLRRDNVVCSAGSLSYLRWNYWNLTYEVECERYCAIQRLLLRRILHLYNILYGSFSWGTKMVWVLSGNERWAKLTWGNRKQLEECQRLNTGSHKLRTGWGIQDSGLPCEIKLNAAHQFVVSRAGRVIFTAEWVGMKQQNVQEATTAPDVC